MSVKPLWPLGTVSFCRISSILSNMRQNSGIANMSTNDGKITVNNPISYVMTFSYIAGR